VEQANEGSTFDIRSCTDSKEDPWENLEALRRYFTAILLLSDCSIRVVDNKFALEVCANWVSKHWATVAQWKVKHTQSRYKAQ